MTTEQTGLTIGQTVSRAQAEALPVGSVLHAPTAFGSGYDLTKGADGRWDSTGDNGRFSTDDLTPDYNTLVRVGGPSQSEVWTVGLVLTDNSQFDRLPVGTVIVNEEGTEYEMLTDNRNRCISNGHVTTNDQRSTRTYTYTIRSLPSDSEVAPQFTVGQRLAAGQPRDLPVGAVVYQTDMPSARYERTSNGWRSLTHGGNYDTYIIGDSAAYTLESLPSRFEVGQRLVTVEDLAEVPNGTVIRANEQASSYRRVEGGYVNTVSPNGPLGLNLFAPNVFSIVSLPTAETPGDPFAFTPGQELRLGDTDRLPVGSVIMQTGRDDITYERDGDEWVRRENPQRRYNSEVMSRSAAYTVVSVGTEEPSESEVVTPVQPGQRIRDLEHMQSLPVGTVLVYRGVSQYTVVDPTYLRREADGRRILMAGRHYPAYTVAEVGRQETFEQYAQRFRVTVYGAAYGNSVSTAPLDRGMESVGVPDLPFSPGMYVHYYDEGTNQHLPVGTVAVMDNDGDGGFAVVGWRGHTWQMICGTGTITQKAMRVVSMPGVEAQPWVSAEGTPRDADRIASFKDEALEFGQAAKEENSWCGVFERTMHAMGIDA